MNRLSGRVALVTGAASGMGAAFSKAFVAEGAQVVLADIATEAGQRLADELGADNAMFVRLDVTDAASWAGAVDAAVARFGTLNVLVNNAGIFNAGSLAEYSLEDWNKVMAINLTGPFLGIKAALSALEAGAPSSIINISSIAGMQGYPNYHGYCASKWGLRGLTRSAALELAERGIRVNSVHPGGVLTPLAAAARLDEDAPTGNAIGRFAEPSEIAGLVVYLASTESSFCTGSAFVADGGTMAGTMS